MSEENLGIISTAMDAWNRGDWDEALKDVAPDVEFDASSNRGEWRGAHRGRDELKQIWEEFTEPWESVRIEIDEFIDAGEHVVTRQTGWFLGRNGIQTETHTGWCWTFRDGVVTRLLASNDLDDALEPPGCRSSRFRRERRFSSL
jgi:ketosteroid isomerase-like protein